MAKQDEISQFFDGVGKLKSLNKEENEELFLLYKQNPSISIRNKIVEGNLRLVIELAKQYSNQGHDFMSLIQEGNLGLMEAVDKFDVEKGFAFSSYATIYIDGRIKDYLKRNNSKFHFVSLDQEDMFQSDNALSNKITDFEDPSTIYQEKAKGELILKALDSSITWRKTPSILHLITSESSRGSI